MVCAHVFFGWLLVKKLISQKTLLGVVICANENWVALLFQDSRVLCSVKCKGWPFGTILVWRLSPRACAPCEGVVSTLSGCAHARGRGAIKPHNEKLVDHFQQTQMTSDKKPDYWLSFPPPTGVVVVVFFVCPCGLFGVSAINCQLKLSIFTSVTV